MRLWFECWGYEKLDLPPDAQHKKGDYGIIRCSHVEHSYTDQATVELQHQRGNMWFDRVTDQRRVEQPQMRSGDAIIGVTNSQDIYNTPTIAYINRADDRRITITTDESDYFPDWIREQNENQAEWIIQTMLREEAVGFPRNEPVSDFSSRVPEPKYLIEPVMNHRFGVIIIDARKSAAPWQPSYMMAKIKPLTDKLIEQYKSMPYDTLTYCNVWYIASGLYGEDMNEKRSILEQLIDKVGLCLQDDKSISLGRFSYRVWSSWEFAYHVRAYPDMMKYIVRRGMAMSGRRVSP